MKSQTTSDRMQKLQQSQLLHRKAIAAAEAGDYVTARRLREQAEDLRAEHGLLEVPPDLDDE